MYQLIFKYIFDKVCMKKNKFLKLTNILQSVKSTQAFITGASSGIGKAYAYILAQLGFDLIITARREDILLKIKKILEKKYSVSVIIIPADLSKSEDIVLLEKELEKRKSLSLIINNAGFGSMGFFSDIPVNEINSMLYVHIIAMTRICRAAIPVLKENKTGYIINVSSLMAFLPIAGQVIYSSTKNYIVHFSKTLQQELINSKIKIQALCPGFTATNFLSNSENSGSSSNNLQIDFLTMSPEEVVEESLLALKKKKVLFIPGRKNRILNSLFNNRPGLWLIKMIGRKMIQSTE